MGQYIAPGVEDAPPGFSLRAKRLHMANQSSLKGGLIHLVLSAIVGVLLYIEFGHPSYLFWTAVVWLITALRSAFCYFSKTATDQAQPLPSIEATAVVLAVFSGLTWGALPVLAFAEVGGEIRLLLTLVTGGMALGSVTLLGYHLPMLFGFYLPVMLPTAMCFFLIGDRISLVMGTLCLLVSVAIGFVGGHFNKTVRDLLKLEFDKDKLLRQREIDQQTLQTALSSRTDGFGVFDKDDRLILWNDRFADNLAIESQEELQKGLTFEDLVRRAWRLRAQTPEGLQSPNWPSWRIEKHRDPKGPFEQKIGDSWALINEYRTPNGHTVLIHTDITDIKQREIALAESEAQKGGVLDSAMDGVVIIDENDTIVEFNLAAEAMFGYSRDEVVGAKMAPLIVPLHQREYHYRGLAAYRETGRMKRVGQRKETIAIRRDGTEFPVEISLTRVVAGERTLFASLIRDITAREEDNRNLIATKEAAEAANQAKGEFLAVMSHEIRTPMNGLLNAIDLLLDSDLGERERTFAMTALHAGESLRTLLEDLIDYTRLDAGDLALEEEPVDLHALIRSSAATFEPLARGKGLDFSLVINDRVHQWLVGDRNRLRQILNNLLSNAIKFTKDGRVDVFVTDQGRVDGERWTRISVIDTGCGISDKIRDQLFQYFVQADRSNQRKHGGAGLGLSIAQKLAAIMGGRITVETQADQGTTFHFDFPAVETTATTAPETNEKKPDPTAKPSPSLQGCHVLLVDDSEVNRAVTGELLMRLGAHVTTADTAAAAIEEVDNGRFDLVLMDVSMPDMDGLAATRHLRAAGYDDRSLPIIALTAHNAEDRQEETRDAGMNGFITKPVRRDALVRAIRDIIPEAFRDGDEGLGDGAFVVDDTLATSRSTIFNHGAFDALRADVGDEAIDLLLETYLTEAAQRVEEITQSVEGDDLATLEVSAHALKSASRSFGAEALGELCAQLEADGREGRLSDAAARLATLDKLHKATVMALAPRTAPVTAQTH